MSLLPKPSADDIERARRLLFGTGRPSDAATVTVADLAIAFASLREDVRKEVWNRKAQM